MSIKLNSVGGGSVTIAEPNTASDFTLSVPARTGTTVLQDGSNNLLMNSGYGSDAVAYGCRAWVNFNGTGTPAIRASGNVSSITDVGTGRYTVNLATALPDANYSVALSDNFLGLMIIDVPNSSASAVRVEVYDSTYVGVDTTGVFVSVFR
jgi:hypothetical protein